MLTTRLRCPVQSFVKHFQVYESGIKELQLLKEQLEADNGEGADESTALAGGGSQVQSSSGYRTSVKILNGSVREMA